MSINLRIHFSSQHWTLESVTNQLLCEFKYNWKRACKKNAYFNNSFIVLKATYFPSTTSNSALAIGKHPQATTLSVDTTEPLSRKSSNITTIPGRIFGIDGSTVNTFWSSYKHTTFIKHTEGDIDVETPPVKLQHYACNFIGVILFTKSVTFN